MKANIIFRLTVDNNNSNWFSRLLKSTPNAYKCKDFVLEKNLIAFRKIIAHFNEYERSPRRMHWLLNVLAVIAVSLWNFARHRRRVLTCLHERQIKREPNGPPARDRYIFFCSCFIKLEHRQRNNVYVMHAFERKHTNLHTPILYILIRVLSLATKAIYYPHQ